MLGEQFAQEVPRQSDQHQLEGAQSARQGVGARQQIEELRESARPVKDVQRKRGIRDDPQRANGDVAISS